MFHKMSSAVVKKTEIIIPSVLPTVFFTGPKLRTKIDNVLENKGCWVVPRTIYYTILRPFKFPGTLKNRPAVMTGYI
jgi:hypothetical protein